MVTTFVRQHQLSLKVLQFPALWEEALLLCTFSYLKVPCLGYLLAVSYISYGYSLKAVLLFCHHCSYVWGQLFIYPPCPYLQFYPVAYHTCFKVMCTGMYIFTIIYFIMFMFENSNYSSSYLFTFPINQYDILILSWMFTNCWQKIRVLVHQSTRN